MSRALVRGKRYHFLITTFHTEFYIQAVHATSFRYSYINNLNVLLSLLGIEQNDNRVAEGQWILPSKRMANKYYQKAIDGFSDAKFLSYLEGSLDEDRRIGEWENTLSSAMIQKIEINVTTP